MRKDVLSDLAVAVGTQFPHEVVEPFPGHVECLELLVRGFGGLLEVGTREGVLFFAGLEDEAVAARPFGLKQIH